MLTLNRKGPGLSWAKCRGTHVWPPWVTGRRCWPSEHDAPHMLSMYVVMTWHFMTFMKLFIWGRVGWNGRNQICVLKDHSGYIWRICWRRPGGAVGRSVRRLLQYLWERKLIWAGKLTWGEMDACEKFRRQVQLDLVIAWLWGLRERRSIGHGRMSFLISDWVHGYGL